VTFRFNDFLLSFAFFCVVLPLYEDAMHNSSYNNSYQNIPPVSEQAASSSTTLSCYSCSKNQEQQEEPDAGDTSS
jgi:hypothetical protein